MLFIKSEEETMEDGNNQRARAELKPFTNEQSINIENSLRDNYRAKHMYFILKRYYGVDNGRSKAAELLYEELNSSGGKLKVKGQKKKTLTPPVSQYKEVLGKRMKIYKKPDSRKEYVKYKGELVPLVEYKNLIKHKK